MDGLGPAKLEKGFQTMDGLERFWTAFAMRSQGIGEG
jgi:hypothetical protein